LIGLWTGFGNTGVLAFCGVAALETSPQDTAIAARFWQLDTLAPVCSASGYGCLIPAFIALGAACCITDRACVRVAFKGRIQIKLSLWGCSFPAVVYTRGPIGFWSRKAWVNAGHQQVAGRIRASPKTVVVGLYAILIHAI